jgi:hypothetical protein
MGGSVSMIDGHIGEVLKPCPECGRKPKVKLLYYPTGAECIIECRRLFCNSHRQVIICCASVENAERRAIEAWNRRADNGKSAD